MPHRAPSPSTNRSLTRGELVALLVPGALLLWLIVTRTFASYLATVDPQSALRLQPREPRALVMQAEAELRQLLNAEPGASHSDPGSLDVIDGEGVLEDRFGHMSRLAKQALIRGFETDAADTFAPTPAHQPSVLTSAQAEPVRQLALQSLQSRPLNADAMSLVARLAEAQGKTDDAARLMEATLQLSVRESYAAYWLLQKSLDDGNIADALRYADLLLRTRSTSMPYVAPKLAKLAESDRHRSQLAALLATNPPWRATFFTRLMALISDARTPLFQFLELKKTQAPPTVRERAIYLNFLVGKNFHDLSYYTWLQFQSPEALAAVKPVKNGGFELDPDGSPFDWTIATRSGVRAAIAAHPSKQGQKVLSIDFRANRAIDPSVRQTLLLPPGAYTLSGQVASSLLGPRGLVWQVRCLKGATMVTTDVLRGTFPGWKPFRASFVVPDQNCKVQTLSLVMDATQGTERFVAGSIWFDDLAIVRGVPAATDQP